MCRWRVCLFATLLAALLLQAKPCNSWQADTGLCGPSMPGLDFFGADVGSVSVADISECCSACKEQDGCETFTFTIDSVTQVRPQRTAWQGNGIQQPAW